MKQEIYKHEGKTVWRFDFKYDDIYSRENGNDENEDTYIGTQQDFSKWCKDEEWWIGKSVWDVKKRHATKEEYESIVYMIP